MAAIFLGLNLLTHLMLGHCQSLGHRHLFSSRMNQVISWGIFMHELLKNCELFQRPHVSVNRGSWVNSVSIRFFVHLTLALFLLQDIRIIAPEPMYESFCTAKVISAYACITFSTDSVKYSHHLNQTSKTYDILLWLRCHFHNPHVLLTSGPLY